MLHSARIPLVVFLLAPLLFPAFFVQSSQSAPASPVTVSFQEGVSPAPSYTGARDATLSQHKPTTNYGSASRLYVDGDDPNWSHKDLSAVLQWDISTIPAGSQVLAASITLRITDSAGAGYPLFEVRRNWAEHRANWIYYSRGKRWQTAGARGALDRGAAVLGAAAPGETGNYTLQMTDAGVSLVQAWVDNPASNLGLILAHPTNKDRLAFYSSEAGTRSYRPKLTVTYTPPHLNQPPVAFDQNVTTQEDKPVNISLSANDPDGDPLAYSIAEQPANGSLSLQGSTAIYTPQPDFSGSDRFTFKASDTLLDSNTAEVNISVIPVNDPPPTPKNVILFIGDGMGPEHIKAAGMYAHGQAGTLSFESFPHRASMTTHSANSPVTDSAASATAMATGVKVDNGVISVAIPGDGRELTTLLEEFRQAGKTTGLVTNSSINDATPAAFAAHEPDRSNAEQIAGDYFNQTRPNVLFGSAGPGITPESAEAAGYTVVLDRASLQALNTETQTYVSGQFGQGMMPYVYDGPGDLPQLFELVGAALAVLDNDPDGFFLLVENEGIDEASHAHDIIHAATEIVELSNAVQAAIDFSASHADTLILVAADHETGGLVVLENNGQGSFPTVSWSTGDHTAARVDVYAAGPNAGQVSGTMDNTGIPAVVKGQGPQTFTLSFQDGMFPDASYAGTRDASINQDFPDTNYAFEQELSVDGDDPLTSTRDISTFIRWDITSLPPGSQVTAASLTVEVTNPTTQIYNLYAVKRDWLESQVTWNVFAAGSPWEAGGARGAGDRGSTSLGTLSPASTGSYTVQLNSDGLALIQSWIDNPQDNFGLILVDRYNSDGIDFYAREYRVAGLRPKLTIRYK